jgi:hypothetical protein
VVGIELPLLGSGSWLGLYRSHLVSRDVASPLAGHDYCSGTVPVTVPSAVLPATLLLL